MRTLLLATNNEGKRREIQAILAGFYPRILTLKQAGLELDVIEDGGTFEENAMKKAVEAMRLSGMDALADDSGLCVDALGGAPGVYSARYAGEPCDDAANNGKLLEALKDVEDEKRTAAFECCIALCRTDGQAFTAKGRCEGRILRAPQGENGFGYDPLFWYEPFGCTFAQASPAQKNSVSHRARALKALADKLNGETVK
ncbi:MAG: XTP/dITP diphosphatase [Bacillota bacterium]